MYINPKKGAAKKLAASETFDMLHNKSDILQQTLQQHGDSLLANNNNGQMVETIVPTLY